MSLTTLEPKAKSSGVEIVSEPASLSRFLAPGCAAAIWRRQIPLDVQTWLSKLSPEDLPRGRVILPVNAIPEALGHLCEMSGLPEGREREWLEKDITLLAGLFSDMLSSPFLRLRLDKVTGNACRKFHRDALTARLVCTYRGTGTQYGNGVKGTDPSRVFTVQTGAPILLRGSLWPERPSTGLLHRSPPIEGTGETRLVLVLDPVIDPQAES